MRVSSSKSLLGFAFALLLIVAVGGCGGGGGGSDVNPVPINNAPTVTKVTPTQSSVSLDVKSAGSMDFTIKADDPDGGSLTCIWTWDAGSATPEEATVQAGSNSTTTFTPPDYDGTCTLQATVSDGELSASVTWTIQVTGHQTQPGDQLRITGIDVSPNPAQPSSTTIVTVNVDNPGGKPLKYTWKTKHGTFSGSGSSVTWNAPSDAGAYGLYAVVSDGTDTVSAGKIVTVAGPSGGLLGEYYKTARDRNIVVLDELRFSRIDPNINFFWEKISPDPTKLGSEGWGARWTGYVKCEEAGTYVFRVHVDDGVRMMIKNDAGEWIWVIPNDPATNWRDHTEGAWLPDPTVPITLDGGKWYPIELDFFQGAENAFITLYWSVNGGAESVIEQSDLKPPS